MVNIQIIAIMENIEFLEMFFKLCSAFIEDKNFSVSGGVSPCITTPRKKNPVLQIKIIISYTLSTLLDVTTLFSSILFDKLRKVMLWLLLTMLGNVQFTFYSIGMFHLLDKTSQRMIDTIFYKSYYYKNCAP